MGRTSSIIPGIDVWSYQRNRGVGLRFRLWLPLAGALALLISPLLSSGASAARSSSGEFHSERSPGHQPGPRPSRSGDRTHRVGHSNRCQLRSQGSEPPSTQTARVCWLARPVSHDSAVHRAVWADSPSGDAVAVLPSGVRDLDLGLPGQPGCGGGRNGRPVQQGPRHPPRQLHGAEPQRSRVQHVYATRNDPRLPSSLSSDILSVLGLTSYKPFADESLKAPATRANLSPSRMPPFLPAN